MFRKFLLGVIFLAIIVGVGATLVRKLPEPAPLCKGCNVILISIDTFGAKHSSVYSPELDTTPFLESLAEGGIVFESAYAQSSWTLPSHVAMLTGQYPWDLNVWDITDPLPSSAPTLAESLKENGYQTAGFSIGSFVQPLMHFDKGFETFVGTSDPDEWSDIPNILNQANDWLQKRDTEKPFFLLIRPFELHDPYGSGEDAHTIGDIVSLNTRGTPPTNAEVRAMRDAYQDDIKKVDTGLRNFFENLAQNGTLENTLVIITSDHGEEFGEHGTVGFHSVRLYTESIHVPLIVSYPKSAGVRIPYSVEVRSIPATVLDFVGEKPQKTFTGESLVPFIKGEAREDRMALSLTVHTRDELLGIIEKAYESVKQGPSIASLPDRTEPYTGTYSFSALKGAWHAIRNADGSTELYNLRTDKDSQRNLGTDLLSLTQSLSLADRILVQDVLEHANEGARNKK